MFVYDYHMGGVYFSEEDLDYWESLYCDSCGDSDVLIGEVQTEGELRELLKYYDYTDEYIEECVGNFNSKLGAVRQAEVE